MDDILALIDKISSGSGNPNGKTPIQSFGFISCASRVHIRHVPFYDPCVILVLSGRKLIGTMACEAGNAITVPAPASYDLRNEPDARGGRYRALIIPFEHDDLERCERCMKSNRFGNPRRSVRSSTTAMRPWPTP